MTLADDMLAAPPPTTPIFLGDLQVVGGYPAKALKALATIASGLHDAYDALPGATSGKSKEACVLASLAAREFLVAVGFTDATVKACAMVALAERDGVPLHSLGIGVPDEPDRPGKFNGHAVTVVPSLDLLLDVTLYPAIRPQWRGALTGMIALPLDDGTTRPVNGLTALARIHARNEDEGVTFHAVWLDRPEIKINRALDFTDARSRSRRRAIANALVARFGRWASPI